MNSLLNYLIQVVIASGILYLYYHFALRNKQFHQYNRFYLLGAVVISILVPFLHIPVYFTPQETKSSFVFETLTVISSPAAEAEAMGNPTMQQDSAPGSVFNPYVLIYYAYILIAAFVLARIAYTLYRISRLKRKNAIERIDTIFFVNTNEPGTPFSFFRWMFWNKDIELRSEKGEQIFRHELFHIQQKHSIDLLFIELLTVIFWINPFFHLMKKELRAIHEFLADQFAVNPSNKWDYAELLLMQALQTKHSLVNPFFHNQIKRRIAMITNSEKTSYRYLRKLLVLPLAILIVTLFAFKYKQAADEKSSLSEKELITVVIDAGHGGIDLGAKSPDGKYTEAQLSLSIARKIKELSPAYNIKVVMTREDDLLPGSAANAEDANLKRVEIANNLKPAAFVAIHVNTTAGLEFQKKRSGFEVYVSGTRDDKTSQELGSAILHEISNLHTTTKELRSRNNNGVWVLDNNNCPAVIIECGYINNEADLAFISDATNQEKIAKSILCALVAQYAGTAASSPVNHTVSDITSNTPSGGYKLAAMPSDTPKVITVQGRASKFPGGISSFKEYIEKNLDQHVPVKNNAPAGTYKVFVEFDVDKDGNVSNINPLTNLGYGMEEEAVRVVRQVKSFPTPPESQAIKPHKIIYPIRIKSPFEFIVRKTTAAADANQNPEPIVVEGYSTRTREQDKKVTDKPIDEVIVQGYPKYAKSTSLNEVVVMGKPSSAKRYFTSIVVSQLKKSTLHQLLELKEDIEILSFTFATHLENGEVISVNYTGETTKDALRKLIEESKPGRLITFESIKVKENGQEKRISSKLYFIISDEHPEENRRIVGTYLWPQAK